MFLLFVIRFIYITSKIYFDCHPRLKQKLIARVSRYVIVALDVQTGNFRDNGGGDGCVLDVYVCS